MLSFKNLLYGAGYAYLGRYASIHDYISYVLRYFPSTEYAINSLDSLGRLVSDDKFFKESLDERDLLQRHLIADDTLALLKNCTPAIRRQLEEFSNFDSYIQRRLSAALEIFSNLGLNMVRPSVFLSDRGPSPYTFPNASAINTDMADKIEHGIEPGIYFIKDNLRPFQTDTILYHELVHTFLGQKNPELSARGLEEGFCELYGAILISAHIIGDIPTRNVFLYQRYDEKTLKFFRLYITYTRQVLFLINKIGFNQVLNALIGGRTEIKRLERLLYSVDNSQIDALRPTDCGMTTILEQNMPLAWQLLLIPSEHFVCSAAAFKIFEQAKAGRSVREIATSARISVELAHECLEELETELLWLFRNRDKTGIAFSDAGQPAASPMQLRYRIRLPE